VPSALSAPAIDRSPLVVSEPRAETPGWPVAA